MRFPVAIGLCLFPLASVPVAQSVLDVNGMPDPAYPGFHAWFDAQDGVNGAGQPASGAAVTSWTDRTGKSHDLVRVDTDASRHPSFQTDVVNVLPAVLFDGNDYIWGDGTNQFLTLTGAKSFFVVSRVDAVNGGYAFDSTSVGGRNALFAGQNSAPTKWHVYAGANPVTVGPDVQAGVWHTHSVLFDTNTNRHFIDSALVASGAANTQSMVGMMLGSRYNLTQFLSGAIAEVLVYDELLSAADRQGIEDYLAQRWFTPPDFTTDVDSISLGTGGVQTMSLDAGANLAGLSYLVMGSTTGTSPGLVLDGHTLPLLIDAYSIYTLNNAGNPPLGGTLGVLDSNGQAQATLSIPSGLPAALSGLQLYHAYVVIELTPTLLAVVHASQAVSLLLQP